MSEGTLFGMHRGYRVDQDEMHLWYCLAASPEDPEIPERFRSQAEAIEAIDRVLDGPRS